MGPRRMLSGVLLYLCCPLSADAAEVHGHEHGSQLFEAFRLELDAGNSREGTRYSWDLNGWIGSDYNKLWLKSKGEVLDSESEEAEMWAMYSRNIDTFWDVQLGARYDAEPESTVYGVLGVIGLAKYFFETEAHLFVSDEGDVSARLRQENDFLLTQRLILQPYLEGNLYAQDVSEQDIGAGLANAEIGLQMRYEVSRKFAPYLDLRFERKFGETAAIAGNHGERSDNFIASVGLRLMF